MDKEHQLVRVALARSGYPDAEINNNQYMSLNGKFKIVIGSQDIKLLFLEGHYNVFVINNFNLYRGIYQCRITPGIVSVL